MTGTTNMGEILIRLSLAEAYQILAIDLDEDEALALQFVKEKMARVVDRCLRHS